MNASNPMMQRAPLRPHRLLVVTRVPLIIIITELVVFAEFRVHVIGLLLFS
jgi:hypothetical protein